MLNLDLSPRETLKARMVAFAYENVRCGLLPDAGKLASVYLERLDRMMCSKPADGAGYWASFYYQHWRDDVLALVKEEEESWPDGEDLAKEAAQDRWMWHESEDTLDLY